MNNLRHAPRRWANRVLVGALVVGLVVLAAGEFYDHSRVDAILQGRINLAQAEIAANGVTIAQAEQRLDAVLRSDSSDINSLKARVSALQAKQTVLEAELKALAAQLAQGHTSSVSTPAPARPASPSSPPPLRPSPTPTPDIVVPLPIPDPTVCPFNLILIRVCTRIAGTRH